MAESHLTELRRITTQPSFGAGHDFDVANGTWFSIGILTATTEVYHKFIELFQHVPIPSLTAVFSVFFPGRDQPECHAVRI